MTAFLIFGFLLSLTVGILGIIRWWRRRGLCARLLAQKAEECGRLAAEVASLRADAAARTAAAAQAEQAILVARAALEKLMLQKKSSEVRTGLIAEQMAPFLADFPYNPADAKFLGQPLDLVVFSEDGVHFVEIKSGSSQLSGKQRKIKEQIDNGLVSFEVYRIKGE